MAKIGTNGTNGTNGVGLLFNWNGTSLGVKRENDTDYEYQDLKGQAGQNGQNGQDGITPVKGTDYFTAQDIAEIQKPVSDQYDSTQTYAVGDYCIYNNVLYRCTTAISTAEAWNSAHWTATSIAAELSSRLEFEIVDSW